MDGPSLKAAAHSLWEEFFRGEPGMHPYIACIGVGADRIVVHLVRKVRAHEKPIPETWQGWPVESKVTGRPMLASHTPTATDAAGGKGV